MQPESSNTQKIILIAVVAGLILFCLYFFFLRSGEEVVIFDEFGNPAESQVVGQDLINLLAELRSIDLDPSIFSSPAFINLTDFSVELQNQPIGRSNPFEEF